MSELHAFCHNLDRTTLYFIMDQVNAFEKSSPNTNNPRIAKGGRPEHYQRFKPWTLSDHQRVSELSDGEVHGPEANKRGKDVGEGWNDKRESTDVPVCLVLIIQQEVTQWWKHHGDSRAPSDRI